MGVDTSGVDQFRQLMREFERGGEGAAAIEEILQNRQGDASQVTEMLRKRGSNGERVVALEDGTGSATSARVNADNNLGTEARFGRTSVTHDSEMVGTTSTACLVATPGRLTFTIQNLDDTIPIHFHLGTGAATTDDPRLDPGQFYSPPSGVAFEGPMSAITPTGTAKLAIVQFGAA